MRALGWGSERWMDGGMYFYAEEVWNVHFGDLYDGLEVGQVFLGGK